MAICFLHFINFWDVIKPIQHGEFGGSIMFLQNYIHQLKHSKGTDSGEGLLSGCSNMQWVFDKFLSAPWSQRSKNVILRSLMVFRKTCNLWQ